MPRIPTVERDLAPRVPALPRVRAPQLAANQLSATMNQVTDFALEQRGREIKRQQRQSIYEAESKVSAVLAEALAEFGNRNDYKVFPGEHDAFVNQRIEEITNGIEDLDVADVVRAASSRQAQRQSMAMQTRAAQLSQAATVAHLDEGIKQDAARYGLASDDAGRAAVTRDVKKRLEVARRSGDISEADYVKQWSTFNQHGAVALAKRLINEDPEEALRKLEDPSDSVLKVLDGEKREALIATAQNKIANTQGGRAAALREARNQQEKDFLERIYAGDLPGIDELLESDLTPERVQSLVKLTTDAAAGQLSIQQDPGVSSSLWERIYNSEHPSPIYNEAQIWHYVGKGITVDDARLMTEQFQQKEAQANQGASSFWSGQKSSLRRQITGVTAFSAFSGPKIAQERWRAYEATIERRRLEKQREGVEVWEMLNPDSEHYILHDVPPAPTPQEMAASVLQSRAVGRSAAGETTDITGAVVPAPPPAPPGRPPRRDGETPDEYMRRIESGR